MKKIMLRIILFMGIAPFFNFLSANDGSGERIELSGREVFIPYELGDIKLYKDSDGFHVIKDDQVYDVQNCFCDSTLRGITNKQLMAFLGRDKPEIIMVTPEELDQINENDIVEIAAVDDIVEITGEEKDRLMGKLFGSGYILVHQMSDGEYSLQARIRLLGGWGWDDVTMWWCIGSGIIILGATGALIADVAAGLAAVAVVATASGATASAATVIATAAQTGASIGTAGAIGIGAIIAIIREIRRPRGKDNGTPAPATAPEPEVAPEPIPVKRMPRRRPVRDLPEYVDDRTFKKVTKV